MGNLSSRIEETNWNQVTLNMNEKGYAVIPKFLSEQQCQELVDLYKKPDGYRKTVLMERYRFGIGAYKYFKYPLPKIIQTIREELYLKLAPIANLWMKVLKIEKQFPKAYDELQEQCHANNQLKQTYPAHFKVWQRRF